MADEEKQEQEETPEEQPETAAEEADAGESPGASDEVAEDAEVPAAATSPNPPQGARATGRPAEPDADAKRRMSAMFPRKMRRCLPPRLSPNPPETKPKARLPAEMGRRMSAKRF